MFHLFSLRSPVGIPAQGSFPPPGWRFDALSVPAWRWMGFSHNSLMTGNTNEPPLGMASRKAKGLSGHKNSGVEPPGQSLSLHAKAGEASGFGKKMAALQ